MAGGLPLETPFGALIPPNITPDRETGIGNWSEADFRNMMKTGIGHNGVRLYPAMPYVNYARMPDRDVDALFAYLKSVRPVRHAVNVNQLRFPYNWRFLMRLWNLVFFHTRAPAPSNHGAAWMRGEYLVNGPGHCGTCHTGKNLFGADSGPALGGALLQGWFAPDLGGDGMTGLGGWQVSDVVAYLKTGRNGHSIASGPMAESVENSTTAMTDSDLEAIAVYLGLERGFFEPTVDFGNSILRLLHYPPVPKDGPHIRAGAHEDINVITLLLGAEEAGLEVKDRDGQWLPVNPPPGSLVCNIGDMLQRLTNHRLPSTTHRVVNPAPERRGVARYSTPFFLHFNSDYCIRTLPGCVDADHPDRYPTPITADEFLQERLREIKLV